MLATSQPVKPQAVQRRGVPAHISGDVRGTPPQGAARLSTRDWFLAGETVVQHGAALSHHVLPVVATLRDW